MEKFWPGVLIVFEGLDGCGKLTQARLLLERLAGDARTATTYFDFPNYDESPVAQFIRSAIRLPDLWWAWPWEAKEALYAADRVCQRGRLVEVLQTPNGIAVCNRYVPSGQAYSAGYFDNAEAWWRCCDYVSHLEYWMNEMPYPHVVFHLTMPARRAEELVAARGAPDAYEQDPAYLYRVGQAYHLLAQKSPGAWRTISAEVDGVIQSPADVHARVWAALQAHPEWQQFLARGGVPVATPVPETPGACQ